MAYGEVASSAPLKRSGVGGDNFLWTVSFTTANTADPTVNSQTKGVVSVVRSGVGIFTVTLPYACKSLTVAQSSSPTSAQTVEVTKTTTTVVVTIVTAGGSTAADTTGLSVDLIIVGELAGT